MKWNGIVWKIRKVEKNKKIEWNRIVEMEGLTEDYCGAFDIIN